MAAAVTASLPLGRTQSWVRSWRRSKSGTSYWMRVQLLCPTVTWWAPRSAFICMTVIRGFAVPVGGLVVAIRPVGACQPHRRIRG